MPGLKPVDPSKNPGMTKLPEEVRNKMGYMKKGGMAKKTKAEKKVGKVMEEFKAGTLHSGKGGKVVKNPKQAVAIALSEAGKTKMAKGGTPKKWIQEAIKKPGALRKAMDVKEGETIPAKELVKAAKAPGKMGQRARLAQTLKKMK